MNEPLRFDSKINADRWLTETGNYGYVHGLFVTGIGFHYIICQFFADGVFVFTAPDEMVLLPDW